MFKFRYRIQMKRLCLQNCMIFCLYKRSAIKRGYFEDEFAEEFVKPSGKKDVIIHRGYWQRIHIFRRVI